MAGVSSEFHEQKIPAAWAQKGAGACPGGGRRAHFGRETFSGEVNCCRLGTERVPIVDGGCRKMPERTRVGNREEPGEGERAGAGAKGKKKGSIRGGVLPYVGEGRRLLPLDCCAWFWRHIVADAVHGWNLCKDSVCNLHKDWPVNLLD